MFHFAHTYILFMEWNTAQQLTFSNSSFLLTLTKTPYCCRHGCRYRFWVKLHVQNSHRFVYICESSKLQRENDMLRICCAFIRPMPQQNEFEHHWPKPAIRYINACRMLVSAYNVTHPRHQWSCLLNPLLILKKILWMHLLKIAGDNLLLT